MEQRLAGPPGGWGSAGSRHRLSGRPRSFPVAWRPGHYQSGGHGIRTHNSFRSTTFPVWPLTIRLPSKQAFFGLCAPGIGSRETRGTALKAGWSDEYNRRRGRFEWGCWEPASGAGAGGTQPSGGAHSPAYRPAPTAFPAVCRSFSLFPHFQGAIGWASAHSPRRCRRASASRAPNSLRRS